MREKQVRKIARYIAYSGEDGGGKDETCIKQFPKKTKTNAWLVNGEA